MKRLFVTSALAFSLLAHSAQAIDTEANISGVLENTLAAWVENPTVIDALRAQNAAHATLVEADIINLDNLWRAEVGATETPIQSEVMAREISKYLIEKQLSSNGVVSEVFVFDMVGLNVGQSGLTSDYWQGDEAKYQETYGKGSGSIHTSEVELDESTGAYLVQVSSAISDPATGELLGGVTFGINIGLLE
ncbi:MULTISPECIES: hypothetical protein [Falsihalocynthiibacter]|uniref:hypothetical protein n=1 Tax=Falsihalocynthiibacter TaxID=2854182 RepID=UPI0030013E5C